MSDPPGGGGRRRRVTRQSGSAAGAGASGAGANADEGGDAPTAVRRSPRSAPASHGANSTAASGAAGAIDENGSGASAPPLGAAAAAAAGGGVAAAEAERRRLAHAAERLRHAMAALEDESGDDHDDEDDDNESSDESTDEDDDVDDDVEEDDDIEFGPEFDVQMRMRAERETDLLNLAMTSDRARAEPGAAAGAGGSRRRRLTSAGAGSSAAAAAAAGGGGAAASRNGARITDPLQREQQASTTNAAGFPAGSARGPTVAAARRSARRGVASADATASANGTSTAASSATSTSTSATRPNRRTAESAAGSTSNGRGTPNATSRALARQENMSPVDAANLGPPTGIRNDEGAMTYYPPLPGGSGGGTGAGPGILTRGGGRNPVPPRPARAVGGAHAGAATAAPVPPRIIPPAHPAGFPGDVVGDWRNGAVGLPRGGPPPVPVGYAAYPYIGGGAGGVGRYFPGIPGNSTAQTAAAAAAARGSDVVDPTALLVACTRRFGSNFYPDPLVPYCGRRLGRNVVPSRDGTCSPLASSRGRVSTCPSCARLHDSLRLSRLRFMFGKASDIVAPDIHSAIGAKLDDPASSTCVNPGGVVVSDAALVAALRSNSGQFSGTVSLLAKQLGIKPRPHPREIAYVARVLGLPETLARIALKKKDCDTTVTIGWICGFAGSGAIGTSPDASPMSICYQEALKEELRSSSSVAVASTETEGNKDAACSTVDEEGLAVLCSLCTEFNESDQSPAMLSSPSFSTTSSPTSRSRKKTAQLKTTGQDEKPSDDNKMDIDTSNGPILLDGHCLVAAKNYAENMHLGAPKDWANGEGEKPLVESDRKLLQSVFDAKINVPSSDPVLMKGLATIIAQSKEKRKGKEEGEGLKFVINDLSPATQHKLFRYAMENANDRCPLCTLPVPSPLAGNRHCSQCQMCEGCIRFNRFERFTKYSVVEEEHSISALRRKNAPAPKKGAKKMVARKTQREQAAAGRVVSSEGSPSSALIFADAATKSAARSTSFAGMAKPIPNDHDYKSEEDEDYDPMLDSDDGDDLDLDAKDGFIDESSLSWEDSSGKSNSIVHMCCSQPNGSHLHHHPLFLQFTRNKTAHCDIEGPCCTGLNRTMRWHVSWSCSVCDFDVCHVCAGKESPSQPPSSHTSTVAADGNGTFDRRLAVVVPPKGAALTSPAAGGKSSKRSILKTSGATATGTGATAAATARRQLTRTTPRAAPALTSTSGAAPGAAASRSPTGSRVGAGRSPASSRSVSAPAPAASASATSRAAASGANGRAAAAARAAVGRPPVITGGLYADHVAAGPPLGMPVAGVLPVPVGADPMDYFGQVFERLGATAAAHLPPGAARLRALDMLPAMAGGAPGLGLIAAIDGRGVGVRLRDARGAAGAGGAAGAAGVRQRRAMEKSQKKKDDKLVAQIWNVDPPPSPGKGAGVVVVNTGIVTPNTATELGSGLLSPASVTDYGRMWLNALTRNAPGGIAGSHGFGAVPNSRSSSMVLLTEDAKAALACFLRYTGEDGKQSTPTALDITTAELYCQKIQSLVPARASAIKVKAYDMIASGKLGLVGTIIAAASFAPLALSRATNAPATSGSAGATTTITAATTSPPAEPQTPTRSNRKRKRDSSPRGKDEKDSAETPPETTVIESHPTTNVCFCGSPIDLKTAPDGCVGCLRCGHACHAPCAADLLLGGGVCPACRAPFYQPQLGADEGRAADGIFHKELLEMDKPESEDGAGEGGSSDSEKKRDSNDGDDDAKSPNGTQVDVKEGDYVRISADRELCKTIQSTCPTSGGWFSDMASCLGAEGQVIAIVPLGGIRATTKAYRIRIKVPFPPPETALDTNTASGASKKKQKNAGCNSTRRHVFRYTRRCRTLQAGRGNVDGHSSISSACIECRRSSDEMRLCANCETCIQCLSRNPSKAEFCTSTVYQCVWNESLFSFVKRGVLPRVYTQNTARSFQTRKDDVATATQEAQKHMMRLRSELTAVKLRRDSTRVEAESIFRSAAAAVASTDTKMNGVDDNDGDDNDGNEDRAAATAMIQLVKDKGELSLPASVEALTTVMAAKGSPFQFFLAFHLLSLAEQWSSDPSSSDSPRNLAASLVSEIKAVQKFVVGRNLEAAARHIRNFNTNRAIEQARWACAYDTTGTYVAKAGVQISLLAYPREGAPRTGFIIEPKARCQATFEHIDANGRVWAQIVEPTDWPDSYIAGLDETSQEGYGTVLVGCRVKRGPNWRYGNQDGGEGNEGIIVKARRGLVLVKWNGIESKFRYRYQPKKIGQNSSSSKKEVSIISAIAPPQGWFQVNTFPPSVDRLCTTLQCCACSKGLCATSVKKAVYQRVDLSKLKKGDRVLVAATMEPVIVEEITSLRIHCSFVLPDDASATNVADTTNDADDDKPAAKRARRSKAEAPISKNVDGVKASASAKLNGTAAAAAAAASARFWYRPVDLVLPADKNSISEPSQYTSEVRMVADKLRTMHEVALLHPDDEEEAKRTWDHAGPATDDIHGDIESYASCIKGHLLHPQCFQTTLLSGQRCPAPGCDELLWLPSIVRDEEEVTCGGEDGGSTSAASSDTESIRAETDLSSHGEGAAKVASNDGDNTDANEFFTEEELAAEGCRMCPACCSGPFLNQHCSDMRTHHGQCSAMAWRSRDGTRRTPCLSNGMTYQVSATEISKRLMQVGNGKDVAEVLPRCPTHNVSVMFNGCRGCGHLFTDLSWHSLPKWDPNAKEKVKLDKKKMQASVLLCSQIRKEAAQLEFEREALKEVTRLHKPS